MSTYLDVIAKKELIFSLAEEFGFSRDVTIYYDLSDDEGEEIELRFIVRAHGDQSVTCEETSLLGGKLSAEFGTEVHVTNYHYVKPLYRYDTDRKSALIDELAIKEVIYRIDNALPESEKVNSEALKTVDLSKIKFRGIAPEDKWLFDGLLKKADEKSKKRISDSNNQQTFLSEGPSQKKRRQDDGDNNSNVVSVTPSPTKN